MALPAAMQIVAETTERSELLDGLPRLWETGQLCDLTLQSRCGKTFQAHKIIVAAVSESLAALVSGRFAEGGQDPVPLDMSEGSLSVIETDNERQTTRGSAQGDGRSAP